MSPTVIMKEKTEKLKEIARMEAQIYRFAELLKEIRDDTVENVERKQVNHFKQLYLGRSVR